METANPCSLKDRFRQFSCAVAEWMGAYWAFGTAILLILAWATTGPLFHVSDTWQLVINTATTIVTFLMVFLIQNTQNRDAKAIHLKLDELIRSTSKARNSLVNLENLTDDQLSHLQEEFARLQKRAQLRREAKNQPNGQTLPTPVKKNGNHKHVRREEREARAFNG